MRTAGNRKLILQKVTENLKDKTFSNEEENIDNTYMQNQKEEDEISWTPTEEEAAGKTSQRI